MTLQRMLKVAGVAIRLIRTGQTEELRFVIRNRWQGLDLDFVSVEDLGLSPDRAEAHSATRAPVLRRIFRKIGIPPGSVVIDFGSGKGSAVIALAGLPFAEVIGVELSPALMAIAERNIARLRLERRVRFVHIDAAEYQDLDRVTHIFMFNPFPCAVMARVMANLAASLTRAPRPLSLVYRNPRCDQAISDARLFHTVDEEQPAGDLPWRIYRHDPRLWAARARVDTAVVPVA
jgi:16S rRNA G966 N2-methylase RsmD